MDLSFEQILALVRQLPREEKIRLSSELEKEVVESRLSRLLDAFKTDALSFDDIAKEAEAVREKIHARSSKS